MCRMILQEGHVDYSEQNSVIFCGNTAGYVNSAYCTMNNEATHFLLQYLEITVHTFSQKTSVQK